MKAYWFSKQDGTTEHQTTPAQIGRTDTVNGEIVPCENGLHASPTPWDAAGYASGEMLWEVEIDDGAVPYNGDKFASRNRTYLRKADMTAICRKFAAQKALSVINLWKAPEIVVQYLQDEAKGVDRSDIRDAARDAAWDAAWDAACAAACAAARDAARDAARAAAWDAACVAAWHAARAAACAAARAAAWDAARDAAWDAACAAARDAARAAAWDAARDAAWDAAWAAAWAEFNKLAMDALNK